MGAYLDTVLPVYGEHFADWWHDRLVPEMQRNFAYLEEQLDAADQMSLAETATLLEDAIDVHDRHWKIHWMLNFAQLSATLRPPGGDGGDPRHGRRGAARAAPELGVRPQLGLDRGAVADEERGPRRHRAARGVRAGAGRRHRGRAPGERPRAPVHRRADRAVPARVRLARRLEPRVHLPDGPRADRAGPRADPRLPRAPTTTTRPRSTRCARDIEAASERDPRRPGRRRTRARCAPPTRSTCGWRR